MSRDCYQNNYRGRGNYSNRGGNRTYRSNYRDSSRSRERNNYRGGYRYNNRSNYRRDNSDQRYRNRSVSQDHSRSRERERDRSSSRESSQSRSYFVEINIIEIRVEMKIGDRVEIIPETDLNQGQDQAPM